MKKIKYLTLIIVAFIACCVTLNAKITTMPTPTIVEEMRSSNFEDEYYIVKTPLNEDNVIYVTGKTKVPTYRFAIRLNKHKSSTRNITVFVAPNEEGEFSIRIDTSIGNTDVPEVLEDKGYVTQADETWDNKPGYKPVEQMEAGIYHLTIARATTPEDADVSRNAPVKWYNGPLGGSAGYAYKEFLLQVSGSNNNPKLISYESIIKNNNNLQKKFESKTDTITSYDGSYVRYLDKYMNDISFVFKNPKTGSVSGMTDSRITYLTSVSNKIVKDSTSDYEKVLKIYEYITSNFYYDRLAFEQKKYQFANPYVNIYNQKNKKASDNSDSNGNVATTCQGFASMVVALARMQGIPARLVQGFHVSAPVTIYQDKKDSDFATNTHWWAEVYVNRKWIIVDANTGTNAQWKRSGFSEAGTWENKGLATYAGFDPSMEVFANSYIYNSIYKGSTSNEFLAYQIEVTALKNFLNRKQTTQTNGKLLNSNYKSSDISTWGTKDIFKTTGYGKLAAMYASNKKLYGALDLSNFKALTTVSVYNNKLTSLKVDGCVSLKKIYASYNNITVFNGSNAKNLIFINLLGNKLQKVTFLDKSKTIVVKRNITVGGFGFKYDKAGSKRVTINALAAPKGYKYLGIYDGNGKRLTTNASYSLNPTTSTYYVKYKKA